ncbi:MAG: hypothetical protein PQJ50_04770 [Spirochaetales bacterium]|nr:hypothetical protein [Spirochaetales bacterium]
MKYITFAMLIIVSGAPVYAETLTIRESSNGEVLKEYQAEVSVVRDGDIETKTRQDENMTTIMIYDLEYRLLSYSMRRPDFMFEAKLEKGKIYSSLEEESGSVENIINPGSKIWVGDFESAARHLLFHNEEKGSFIIINAVNSKRSLEFTLLDSGIEELNGQNRHKWTIEVKGFISRIVPEMHFWTDSENRVVASEMLDRDSSSGKRSRESIKLKIIEIEYSDDQS